MPQIVIRADERAAFIGKTGSGKTYLVRYLAAPISRVIVIDGKGTIPLDTWNLEEGARVERQLLAGHPARVRIRGGHTQLLRGLDLAWRARHVLVYIDEMLMVSPTTHPPIELARLYQLGRELKIGVWTSTQRPRNVPPIMFTEAEWLIMFRVSRPDDRKAVADYGDEYETMRQPIRDTHGFYVYNQMWRKPVYYTRFVARDIRSARIPA